MDDGDIGRKRPAGGGADRRLVADEDQPVVGVTPGMVEGAGDDFGHAVIAAHRVDGDANPIPLRSQRHGLRSGHRVSARSSSGAAAGLSSMASRPLW